MNELKIFEKSEFGQVRIQMDANNEPLFCLADVCKAVGLQNPSSVKQRLDTEDVQLIDLHALKSTEGVSIVGNTMSNFVTESGFYDVLLQSNSQKVKPFRKWVTSEVLPSIRKHGAYVTETTIDSIIANPENGIKLLQALQKEREEKRQLEARAEQQQATIELQANEIKTAAPKVEYYDNVLQSINTITTTQVAKQIGLDANKLNKKLNAIGLIFRQSGQWILHTPYSAWNLHATRTQTYTRSDRSTGTSVYTVWTQRGVRFIIALHENGWNIKKALKSINPNNK